MYSHCHYECRVEAMESLVKTIARFTVLQCRPIRTTETNMNSNRLIRIHFVPGNVCVWA